MSLMGYTEQDVERMIEIVYYSKQDALDNGDNESAEWLQNTADFLDGMIVEGRI